jgi:Rieske Fe-S protein
MANNSSDKQTPRPHAHTESGARRRRNFLLLLPALVFGGAAATIASAAFRFLRPFASKTVDKSELAWLPVAPLSELAGGQPLMRKVSVERAAGWASTREERTVYVLPQQNGRVLSAVCPHENCEVVWRDDARDFLCPCHDSRFAPDGARISGPAQRGLYEIPARVENGILQIQTPSPTPDPAA